MTLPQRRDIGIAMLVGAVTLFCALVLSFFIVLAQGLALFLLRYIALLALGWIVYQLFPKGTPWNARLIFSVLVGASVLNYGFATIALGFGPAKVTVLEGTAIIVVLSLLPIYISELVSAREFWIACIALILPLAIHLPADLPRYGLEAARDALNTIDIVFFFAGALVVLRARSLEEWRSWRARFLQLFLCCAAIYAATYPFSGMLMKISPVFNSYQQPLPVFGNHISTGYNALLGIAATFIIPAVFGDPARWPSRIARFVFPMIWFAAFLVLQLRSLYVAAAFIFLMLIVLGKGRLIIKWSVFVVLALATLATLDAYDIRIEGSRGRVSIDTLISRMQSVTGQEGDEAGAQGVNQRAKWWSAALGKWQDTPQTMIFGTGYGEPLTDFGVLGASGGIVVVREPHNSYITSLARGGLIYFLPWACLLMLGPVAAYRRLRERDSAKATDVDRGVALWGLMLFAMLLIVAMVEPVFELPYFSTLYYFFCGVFVAERLQVARAQRAAANGMLARGARPARI